MPTSLLETIKYHSLDMQQNDDGNMVRELFLVFYGSTHQHFWDRILKKGFYHVTAVQFDGFDYIAMNAGSAFSFSQVLPLPVGATEDEMVEFIQDNLGEPDVRVVKVTTEIKHKYRQWFPFDYVNCTTEVKKYLGWSKRCMITPYQLYKHCTSTEVNSHVYPKNTKERLDTNSAGASADKRAEQAESY